MSPVIRIFLLTYRRPHLLRRALESLLAQTFSHWVCELHNDAPDDSFPRELVATINDPRITLHHHTKNLGAVANFNHAYSGGPEPYSSILEDDNWWEPDFLAAALRAMEDHPEASLAWANMRIWREEPGGHWTDTGRTIWRHTSDARSPRVFMWPEALQFFDAVHSQGAMVFRPSKFRVRTVPASTPLAIIEPVRERAATGELLLLPMPLANFALTVETSRSKNRVYGLQGQLLVSSSFFEAVAVDDASLARLWESLRTQTPKNTNLLFLTAIALHRHHLLKSARLGDWFWFLLNVIRHPLTNLNGLRFRQDQAELCAWLVKNTQVTSLSPSRLLDKRATLPVG